jgi:hypothetical protein
MFIIVDLKKIKVKLNELFISRAIDVYKNIVISFVRHSKSIVLQD